MPQFNEFTVDGVRQVYHLAGRGPLCVAHPGGPGLHWSYLRSPELEQHFTMVYPEPVGTGGSGRVPEYHLDTFVRFLAALVERLGEPRVYLLGHSHGGFVAQRYALDHPDRVAGLILYSTSPTADADFWASAAAGIAAYPGRFPEVPEAALVPAAFQAAVSAPDDETMTAAFAAALPLYFADFWSRRAEFAPFQAAIRMSHAPATASDPAVFDVRGRLAELTVPAVVITGRHDFICGPSWGRQLAAGLPHAVTHTLADSGHFGHVEQPAAFAAAVTDILRHAR